MKRVENLSKAEKKELKQKIGEAFVRNELFHEWGSEENRKKYVLRYMDAYVEYVYSAGLLYQTEDGNGFIGLEGPKEGSLLKKGKMLLSLFSRIPLGKWKKFLHHVKQIADGNERYQKQPHIEVLMVCVDKQHQGKGIARKLVEFAMEKAKKQKLPLLFDTDMPEYAKMYQYLGCSLYNTIEADNGVIRYNLVWEDREGTQKEVAYKPESTIPYSLHDMVVTKIRFYEDTVRFYFKEGYVKCEGPYKVQKGNLRVDGVALDFAQVSIMNRCGEEGAFEGERLSLAGFVDKYTNMGKFEIVDELYGYNQVCYCGYLDLPGREETLEMMVQMYFTGDIVYELNE